jgi:tRNA G18 (ribose-2'-O)-methylase SpoU
MIKRRLKRNKMSYFDIGVYHTKCELNIGTLWRSAYQLGASGIFTIGKRYKKQATDTHKTMRHIPLRHFITIEDFLSHRPINATLIGVEIGGENLSGFNHPKQALYLLGAEDNGLPQDILYRCNSVISIESVGRQSYNVAVAGSIIMYDRMFGNKAYRKGK